VPLDPTWRLPAAMREHPRGFGFWMRIAESDPPRNVWIWVTAECLDQLDSKTATLKTFVKAYNLARQLKMKSRP
jgi:hypothetical protein